MSKITEAYLSGVSEAVHEIEKLSVDTRAFNPKVWLDYAKRIARSAPYNLKHGKGMKGAMGFRSGWESSKSSVSPKPGDVFRFVSAMKKERGLK